MEATVFEIAGGSARPPLVKGVGTKRLGKGMVKARGTSLKRVMQIRLISGPISGSTLKKISVHLRSHI